MKSIFKFKKYLFLFSAVFLFSLPFFLYPKEAEKKSSEPERTVINIENAKSTQYEKDKESGNDCIFLSGDVKISVTKGKSKNIIYADILRYDRVTEMIYADGNVSMEQTNENSGGQTLTASSLMFNVSTLEGIFDDGRAVQKKSDALNLPSGATLIVASDIFGRSESNTIAFKKGNLTFCDEENPHWHINASRIWLLPGGEFAFLNALLFIGSVPVMYFPAFYYPKDELVFNPVFGYRKREGYFIQTTSYAFGRKPLEKPSESSKEDSGSTEKLKALFNFVKPSVLKEQRYEGLMLHNLDSDYKGDTSNYLKFNGDYYSNLGITAGFDGAFKPKKYISALEGNLQLGFSNTVFEKQSDFMPFSNLGNKIYDKSNFLGFSLPFRYGAKFKLSINKPFSFSISIPVYSDPYFNSDFGEREETMDWISYLTDTAGSTEKKKGSSEISSFSWTLAGSYSANLPPFIKPYISSLSLKLDSSISFSSLSSYKLKNDEITDVSELSEWKRYSPERKFYYPSQITPSTFSANISGSFIEFSTERSSRSYNNNKKTNFPSELELPKDLSPKEQENSGTEKNNPKDKELKKDADGKNDLDFTKETVPILSSAKTSLVSIPGIDLSVKYSVKPSLTSQFSYSSSNLKEPEDFDWENLRSSMYTLKIPSTLDNNFSYAGNFFKISNSYTFDPVFQEHPYISSDIETGGYRESDIKSLRKTDYAAQKKDLTNTNNVSLKPFYYIDAIKDSGITWRSTIKMIKTKFIGDEDNPEWEYSFTDWEERESITVNALDFIFAANQFDNKFSQSFTLSSYLPPQPDQYSGILKLGFPDAELSFESGIKKDDSQKNADEEWIKLPFKQNLSFSLFNKKLKFSQSYIYNLKDAQNDSLKLSIDWQGLQASYTMNYTEGYDFSYETGWKIRAEKEFLPYSLSFTYSPAKKTISVWKNRIKLELGLSSSAVADLLRPTDSYFVFSPSISLKIHEFLTFTFSSSSKNSVIYRYFGNKIGLPGEENIFFDLFNSFSFWDEEARKKSAFKLKNLKFSIVHDLHDWDFSTEFKLEPRLITEDGTKYYDFNPHITVSIIWRPMAAMKTEIIDEYGEWKLNP